MLALSAAALFAGEPRWAPARPAYALPAVDEALVRGEPFGALRVTEPAALVALERRGLALAPVLARAGGADADLGVTSSNADLEARSKAWRSLIAVVDADVDESSARPGIGREVTAPDHPFVADWLRSPRAHFELVAVVDRLDRKLQEPLPGCGEVRLVYRLALAPPDRPTTRLPMTVNAVLTQPEDPGGGCRGVASRWLALAPAGAARVAGALALVDAARLTRVEIDLQNEHGPSIRRDEDDHAEYVLRVFDVTADGALAPRLLLDTPRPDLDAAERDALGAWVARSFDDIDRGTAVVPDRFLATRAISVAPRGVARAANRPFRALFGERGEAFASLPFDRARLVRSPAALVRRLDELTCEGCHQSRSIAGFHVLGEERDPDARFNALAHGTSSHFDEELPWREALLERVAAGDDLASYPVPRPFAERASVPGDGYGTHCAGRRDDPTFAGWTCGPGLHCRDLHGDPLGIGACAPDDGRHPGDACQSVLLEPRDGPDGDRVLARHAEACTPSEGADPRQTSCSPNAFGFPGGTCSDACDVVGERRGLTICAELPLAGFESDCFVDATPVERCLPRHLLRRRVRACDPSHPCRDDYACARVPGASPDAGACVPPYFVLQARVDGPLLDR